MGDLNSHGEIRFKNHMSKIVKRKKSSLACKAKVSTSYIESLS